MSDYAAVYYANSDQKEKWLVIRKDFGDVAWHVEIDNVNGNTAKHIAEALNREADNV